MSFYNFFIKQNSKKNYFNFLKKDLIKNEADDFYFQMVLIRKFEKKLLSLFEKNLIHGTTHTYIGQESNSTAIFNHLDFNNDIVFSNHRCHGHFISYSGLVVELMSEILGKKDGVCNGKGGSQHLHFNNFYSNGVLAGSLPAALGTSYANKKNDKVITVAFTGDGSLGSGYFYETLNLSSLWNCPILFVCENNFIAQTTPIDLGVSGDIGLRAKSFNIKTFKTYDYDVLKINNLSKDAIKFVRKERKPAFLEIGSVRLGPHSKGDDTRDKNLINKLKNIDPLIKIESNIKEKDKINQICERIIEECFEIANNFETAK